MELLYSILNNSGTVVLANNERLTIPPTMRFIWEVSHPFISDLSLFLCLMETQRLFVDMGEFLPGRVRNFPAVNGKPYVIEKKR